MVGCVNGYTDLMQNPNFVENATYKPMEFMHYFVEYPLKGKFWWCNPVSIIPI